MASKVLWNKAAIQWNPVEVLWRSADYQGEYLYSFVGDSLCRVGVARAAQFEAPRSRKKTRRGGEEQS